MRRRIVLLLIAFVLAGFSATAVVAYGHSADERALEGAEGTWVLLATAAIPADTTGADIRGRKLVRQVLMPARTVPSGAITKLDPSYDKLTLNAPLQPDQMLMSGHFQHPAPAGPSPSPTFVLPSGKIAVSVELTIARQVAGNVDNGAAVTIWLTEQTGLYRRDQKTTVVVAKATVISVGERPVPTSATPTPSPAKNGATVMPTVVSSAVTVAPQDLDRYVVTVAVTPSEGARLVNGYNSGELHLGLVSTPAPSTSATPDAES
ncbi:RcpC/CpaB family pilus assembly protein [Paractinoplanes toevensis]|uniref:Flp pilus assembly protein RcpC/CpaB domain-containing protein n=1 Tax=Paractinoplanes toevensis TaxID=571911 RepID=A0A919TH89_9ACTN|nr:RcpC/CpaB family pilus assembly protein [Actinoplanes toevensis]GIM95505.1 hypothetical protein Ato02nite_072980 [Actinoplanes toevensis]